MPERPERTQLAQAAQLIVRQVQLLELRHRTAHPCGHVLEDVAREVEPSQRAEATQAVQADKRVARCVQIGERRGLC